MSTEKQAEAGLSLEAQTAKIHAMGLVRGVEVAEVFVDAGKSAKTLDRPEMERLLALVDAGAVGAVIIAKLDRLTRSIKDLAALLDRFDELGVSLVSIAESLDTRSSAGRLVTHIMGSVADWERREIGNRTRDVLQHKRSIGQRVGTLPFGSELSADGVHLQPAPVEQRLIEQLATLKATGKTTRAIAAHLKASGWTTRRGTPYSFQSIARILRRTA